MQTPLARLKELWDRIDAFTARVGARYPGALACRAGCDGCCQRRLSVTGIEARAIVEGLARRSAAERTALAGRARSPSHRGCAALLDDGRCGIYEVRPLVCRSHGLPLRLREDGREELAVCELNFVSRPLAGIEADCVLDQQTLSTIVLALDAADAAEQGRPAGERQDLAALLAAAEGA